MTGITATERNLPITRLLRKLLETRTSADAVIAIVRDAELAVWGESQKTAKRLAEKRERERLRGQIRRAKTSADAKKSQKRALPMKVKKVSGLPAESKELERSKSLTLETKKPPREKSVPLPPDWQPKVKHFELGHELGYDDRGIKQQADSMRDWAEANKHRAVARKSVPDGWDRTFSNWLRKHPPRRGPPNRGPSLGDIARGQFDFGERR